jgi:hypothetical protein
MPSRVARMLTLHLTMEMRVDIKMRALTCLCRLLNTRRITRTTRTWRRINCLSYLILSHCLLRIFKNNLKCLWCLNNNYKRMNHIQIKASTILSMTHQLSIIKIKRWAGWGKVFNCVDWRTLSRERNLISGRSMRIKYI